MFVVVMIVDVGMIGDDGVLLCWFDVCGVVVVLVCFDFYVFGIGEFVDLVSVFIIVLCVLQEMVV